MKKRRSRPRRSLLKRLGPGFVTGASDEDPAGIGVYIQSGAAFGYAQLWTALFTLPIMAAVQEMCGRIGMVTGEGLSMVLRRNFARPILMTIVGLQLVTNTVNVGADLSAMAESVRLVWHVSYGLLLTLTTTVTVALISAPLS